MLGKHTKIMIMAAGTGGHVFPGIAIAKSLMKQGIAVCWLGTPNGMEKKIVEKEDIPFANITIKGLRGNGILGWIKAPYNISMATVQAIKIIKQQQPDIVLGMGGFVCGPGGIATKILKKTLIIHEQNAIAGLTNKYLSKISDKTLLGFASKSFKNQKVQIVGNPIREGLQEISTVKTHTPRNILVLGGSRGAVALNKIVPQALALIPEEQRPKIVHQAGVQNYQLAKNNYNKAKVQAEVVCFINDMKQAYQVADMLICRAGALTISELMASARAAIMIPYPHAVDDHQSANAKVLVDLGGGKIISQADLTAEILAKDIVEWTQNKELEKISKQIRQQSINNATKQITDIILRSL